jgi:hypothetical protein
MKILERSGMIEYNMCHVPMEARLKLSKQSTTYRSIVRSLRYLVNTHSDLVFTIAYVSLFLEEPWKDHLAAVKKILRYVVDTCNWGLWFSRKKENQALLTGFSDFDFARDVDARKSTIGIIFFLANSLITW